MAADGAPSLVFLPALPGVGETVELTGDEAHYLRRVVRVRAGERVGATDGAGTRASIEVLECGDRVLGRCVAREVVSRGATLEIACGCPEGDRADWMVEKLAELGTSTLRLVDTRRGRWERFAARRERWERLATAALRQSRSAFRMTILPPSPLAGVLAALPPGADRWLCRPDGRPARTVVRAAEGCALAVIGPSSGFTDDELKAMGEGGFVGVALAAVRLRTETAAVAMAALWAAADSGSGPVPGVPRAEA